MANPHEFHTPKSHYSKADLILSGRGGYFGPGNAQLPAPPMLMMDRITALSLDGGAFGKGHVVAELDITPATRLVRYEVDMRQVRRGKLGLAVANGRLFADDTCVYVAKDLRVGMIAPASG